MSTLWIDGPALNLAISAGQSALPRETGGILLGHFVDGEPTVTMAPVVTDSRATRIRYRRDVLVASRTLDLHIAGDRSGLLGYLGEWHTHPLPVGPSRIDHRAIHALARDGGDEVLLLVISRGLSGWRPHGVRVATDGRVTPIRVCARKDLG